MTHVPVAAVKNISAATVNDWQRKFAFPAILNQSRQLARPECSWTGALISLNVSVSGNLERRFMVVRVTRKRRRIVTRPQFNDLVFEHV